MSSIAILQIHINQYEAIKNNHKAGSLKNCRYCKTSHFVLELAIMEVIAMKKKQSRTLWLPQAATGQGGFDAQAKARIISETVEGIKKHSGLLKKISVPRTMMRTNKLYLYELFEPMHQDGATLIKPLIDGKYIEIPYARITFHDTEGNSCTMELQRYNDEWFPVYKGPISECLSKLEADGGWL
jgi:hypothetical protein